MGAHIAGFAAKKIKEQLGRKPFRISGLDPAGPYFNQFRFVPEERLSRNDADYVDVIHTDSSKILYSNNSRHVFLWKILIIFLLNTIRFAAEIQKDDILFSRTYLFIFELFFTVIFIFKTHI